MDSFFFDLAVSTVLSVIKAAFKSKSRRADLKRALLKVRNQINALYYGDPDFE
jgi:hypothetical protein